MNCELKNILQKVNLLYQKYGIKSVTMDDVARELGISKKTLYQFFKDKHDLVKQVVEVMIQQGRELFNCSREEHINAIEELLLVNHCLTEMLKDHSHTNEYDLKKYYPELYSKIREVRQEHIYRVTIDNIKRGKSEGLYRKEIDEEVIGKLYLSRFTTIFEHDIFSIDEFISPRFFKELFVYHIRGLANEKGIKVLEENLKKFSYNDNNL